MVQADPGGCTGTHGPLAQAVLKPEVPAGARDPAAPGSHVDISGAS